MSDVETIPSILSHVLSAASEPFAGDGAPAPFAKTRLAARQALEQKGLPTRKDEAWKYTDLRKVLATDYAVATQPMSLSSDEIAAYAVADLDCDRIVFVDGILAPEHTQIGSMPAGVHAGSVLNTSRTAPELLGEHFGQLADSSADAFAAMNTAMEADGLALIVPKSVVLDRPIHVVHVSGGAQAQFVQNRCFISIGENAQAQVIESFHGRGDAPIFRNEVTEIWADRAAVLEHVRIQDAGAAANGVSLIHARHEASSNVTSLTFTFATGTQRNNSTIVPAGEGCESHLGGLYVCTGKQHVDTSTLVDHVAPGCMSNELFKGIVYDESTGVFNGKVFVRRAAQQTNAYQQSQGVILSPNAHHHSKPELEIYADDVKCSHGSTTGSIDAEALFYLRSRGVSEADARSMLLYAFAHDVVEMVRSEPLRDHLDALIAERLK